MSIVFCLVITLVVIIIFKIKLNDKDTHIENLEKEKQELNNSINEYVERNSELSRYNLAVEELKKSIEELRDSYKEKKKELNDSFLADKIDLEKTLDTLDKAITCKIIDITDYENVTSEECKNKLSVLKSEINDLIKDGKAVKILSGDNRTKKEITANTKQIILCFTAECANIINNLTIKNIDTARSKIERSYNTINKVFEIDGLQLEKNIFEKKLEELSIVYAYMKKVEQEREEQKAIREQMLEEEKVRREIEREKNKIEKEENQFKNEITKLMNYLQKASDIEKQLYIDKIRELEDKLKLLENDKKNVLEREQNTRAGYVYVISNIGSFGENIYKIGMTRRLEPMDRVKELGDASVPFEFDVHAMIFSSDAPALESTLHNTFKGKEVNKVNLKKEFYRVSLDEIEKIVKEKHNATVKFTKVAEAAQYRETLMIESKNS